MQFGIGVKLFTKILVVSLVRRSPDVKIFDQFIFVCRIDFMDYVTQILVPLSPTLQMIHYSNNIIVMLLQTPSSSPSTRPPTLEKTGGLRPKISQDNGDQGNDQPTNQADDRLLEDLYKDEPLKYQKPRNIRQNGQPGAPQGINIQSRRGTSGGLANDAGM